MNDCCQLPLNLTFVRANLANEVADNAVEVVERRRRDAEPVVPGVLGQYAPAYPQYYVYPVTQKVKTSLCFDNAQTELVGC